VPLDKSGLKSDLEKIFNVETSPEVQSESHCGQLITDAIVKYLGDAKIGGLKAPGMGPIPPAPSPMPDPAFVEAGQPISPMTPPIANQSIMMAGWVGAMMGNIADVKVWAAADSAMMGYVAATYTAFSIGGYMLTGAAAPGPINLGSVMGEESEDSADIASKLSSHIHSFFTGCIFTGAYVKGVFAGLAPHVAPLE
jgi:hypothetical protein